MKRATVVVATAASFLPSCAIEASSSSRSQSLRGALERSSELPTEDGVCIDQKGWQDARGYGCFDYKKHKYCTEEGKPGPGWWQTWGTLGAYSSLDGSPLDACCACGGGVITCCKSFKEFEHEKADIIKQVRKYAVPLVDKARVFVGNAGKVAEAKLIANLTNSSAVAGSQYTNRSAVLRDAAIKETEAKFSNLTQHDDKLFESAQFHLVRASSEVTWAAVNKTIDGDHHKALATAAMESFRNAKAEWESSRMNISLMARKAWFGLKEYYSDHNSSMSQLVANGEAVNNFADESQKAGETVRWGRQASLLAAELTDLAGNRTENVDGLVHQAEGRTARALQLTSKNSGTLDTLEGMVDESEDSSKLAGQVAGAR